MLPHDELYHYGVKGMKWGVRRYGKALGEGAKLGVRHPILQDRAYKESMAKQSRATRARRLSLFSKTSEIEDMNRRTKRMINEKKQQRLAKIDAMPKTQHAADKILRENRKKNPILSGKDKKISAIKELQKRGFSKQEAVQAQRSYDFAVKGLGIGATALAIGALKIRRIPGPADFAIFLIGGAASGRLAAKIHRRN